MSKRKSKKSDKYTEITNPIDYLPETGEGGDVGIDTSYRQFISIDVDGVKHALS